MLAGFAAKSLKFDPCCGHGLPIRHRTEFRIGPHTPCPSLPTPFIFPAPSGACPLPLHPTGFLIFHCSPLSTDSPPLVPLPSRCLQRGPRLDFRGTGIVPALLATFLPLLCAFASVYLQNEISNGYCIHRKRISPVKSHELLSSS